MCSSDLDDCCGVGTLAARLAPGRVRSRDPWGGGRVPSRWERSAGVTQLTGWAHLPLQREVAPGALGAAPTCAGAHGAPSPRAPEPSGAQPRGGPGVGAEPASTDPPNLKFWFPPGPSAEGRVPPVGRAGGAGSQPGSRWGGGGCGAGLRDEAGAWPALEGEGKGPRLLREAGLEASGSRAGRGMGDSGGSAGSHGASAASRAVLQGPRLPPPRAALAFPERSVCEDASLALGCKRLPRL